VFLCISMTGPWRASGANAWAWLLGPALRIIGIVPSLYQAQLRHAAHYLNVLNSANGLYFNSKDTTRDALNWLKAELENIRNGQLWAAQRCEDETGGLFCLLYPLLGPALLEHYLSADERLRWLDSALQVVERYPQYSSESSLLIHKGRALAAGGHMQEALTFHHQSLSRSLEIGDNRAEAAALSNLGVDYFNLGESSSAIECHTRAITLFTEFADNAAIAQAKGDLGNVHYFLGDYARATELFEQRLAFAKEANDPRHKVAALLSLGLTRSASGRFRDALEDHVSALLLTREIGDLRAEGEVLANLGNVYAVLGENERALETSERRLAIARELGDIRGEGKTLFNRGVVYRELGDDEQAILSGLGAIKILEEIGDPYVVRMQIQVKEWQDGPKKKAEYHVEEDPTLRRRLELSPKYERQLTDWESLPWWRRIITKRPALPFELIRKN
jgi:tetratricopeptide (TPR) repeat protein